MGALSEADRQIGSIVRKSYKLAKSVMSFHWQRDRDLRIELEQWRTIENLQRSCLQVLPL